MYKSRITYLEYRTVASTFDLLYGYCTELVTIAIVCFIQFRVRCKSLFSYNIIEMKSVSSTPGMTLSNIYQASSAY